MEQDNTIIIEIHQLKFLHIFAVVSVSLYILIFSLAFTETELGYVASFVLFLAVVLVYAVYDDKIPTVLSCDGNILRYKHILKEHEIKLSDIKSVHCDPYEVRIWYSTQQRIMLRIKFKDEDRDYIEFNDKLDSAGMLDEKLGRKKSDIPLLKLYEYLKEKV